MQNKVFVYFSRLIESVKDIKVYPKERQAEILSCTSKKVITEKYTAWKLLERALKEQFDTDIEKVNFEKQKNGKWVMDKGYFSISHSNGNAPEYSAPHSHLESNPSWLRYIT